MKKQIKKAQVGDTIVSKTARGTGVGLGGLLGQGSKKKVVTQDKEGKTTKVKTRSDHYKDPAKGNSVTERIMKNPNAVRNDTISSKKYTYSKDGVKKDEVHKYKIRRDKGAVEKVKTTPEGTTKKIVKPFNPKIKLRG